MKSENECTEQTYHLENVSTATCAVQHHALQCARATPQRALRNDTQGVQIDFHTCRHQVLLGVICWWSACEPADCKRY